jgi:decaprenyl-phosphate phosphoribosyltransferase
MCLASSGTYYWNDALDIESDREHPTKRFRPIASGLVSLRTAHIVGTILIVAALTVAATTGRWQTVGVVALYLAVTLSYSVIWKHIAVVDLVAIASGFVLRAAAGAVAVDVPMSSWFVLCITFGSLFIVTGKRFAESRELGDDAHKLRATLGDYSEGFLRFVLALACGGALVSYCMWAFERRDLVDATNHFYELSIVPVLTAFLRYALTLEQGRGAAPEEVFASDRVLQILGVLWVIVFGLAVYTG